MAALIKLPPPQLLRDWARTVANSILTISDEKPKVPTIPTNTSSFGKHVMILTWLDNLKENLPTAEKDKEMEGSANKGAESNEGMTSFQSKSPASSPPDTIEDLQRIIIDMIITTPKVEAMCADCHAVTSV